MGIPKAFFFLLFLQFPIIYCRNDCPSAFCGNNNFPIKYPFQMEARGPAKNCSYPGFDLKCNSQGIPVFTLADSGDFFVRFINYDDQEIQLYDPHNCLPRRLLNFSLSSSPFLAAKIHENYTFFSCPPEIVNETDFIPIACLSSSSVKVVAISSGDDVSEVEYFNCKYMTSHLPLPDAFPHQYDYGFKLDADLYLTWKADWDDGSNDPDLVPPPPPDNKLWRPEALIFFFYCIVAAFLILTIVLTSMFWFRYISNIRRHRTWGHAATTTMTTTTTTTTPNPTAATITLQPSPVPGGLNDSTIELYTKVVFDQSGQVIGTTDLTCAICLADYCPGESLRCIAECQHYFHADCIREWLTRKGVCPVCRKPLVPAVMNSKHGL